MVLADLSSLGDGELLRRFQISDIREIKMVDIAVL